MSRFMMTPSSGPMRRGDSTASIIRGRGEVNQSAFFLFNTGPARICAHEEHIHDGPGWRQG
jgi:hypothetical protein